MLPALPEFKKLLKGNIVKELNLYVRRIDAREGIRKQFLTTHRSKYGTKDVRVGLLSVSTRRTKENKANTLQSRAVVKTIRPKD